MKNRQVIGLVLAAGKGTRMKSALPKVLHPLLGKPLLSYVIDLLYAVEIDKIVVVIGHGGELVKKEFSSWGLDFVVQQEQRGTGHAVRCAEEYVNAKNGDVLIVCGDTPLFRKSTFSAFLKAHKEAGHMLSILSAVLTDPTGYGRIIRDEHGVFSKIVEEKDASDQERRVTEINTGTYLADRQVLFELVKEVRCNNAQNEFYLTDIVSLAKKKGYSVGAFGLASEEESMGVNSRSQLVSAEKVLLNRVRSRHMARGVTFMMPDTTYVEQEVTVGKDVTIGNCCVLKGQTAIGDNVTIGSFSYIEDGYIPNGSIIAPYTKIIKNKDK